ncbi:MAG: superoxide dismutase [Candidatus Nanohaloarchaea archaeon]
MVEEHGLMKLPYDYDALTPHISEQVLEWHHDVHHQGYVDGWNSAEAGLERQREEGDFSDTGSLLRSFTHNFCGNVLHNVFWNSMTPGGGGKPEGELMDRIEEDFGSYENWKNEFVEAAKAAGGWALLVYVPYSNELHNVAVDKHDNGAVWGAHPILAVDVWEHSYYHDYGPDRGDFIENVFEVINWDYVAKKYREMVETFES